MTDEQKNQMVFVELILQVTAFLGTMFTNQQMRQKNWLLQQDSNTKTTAGLKHGHGPYGGLRRPVAKTESLYFDGARLGDHNTQDTSAFVRPPPRFVPPQTDLERFPTQTETRRATAPPPAPPPPHIAAPKSSSTRMSTPVKYSCQKCPMHFSRKQHLQDHLNSHNGLKQYVCEICRRPFVQKSHLTRHLKIHKGERKHLCKHCGWTFVQASNMRNHQKTHLRPRTKQFRCNSDSCPKTFATLRSKNVHARKFHFKKHGNGAYCCIDCHRGCSNEGLKGHTCCLFCKDLFGNVRARRKHLCKSGRRKLVHVSELKSQTEKPPTEKSPTEKFPTEKSQISKRKKKKKRSQKSKRKKKKKKEVRDYLTNGIVSQIVFYVLMLTVGFLMN